jgi:NitT/TauT family transport system permease protein
MNKKKLETYSPLILLVILLALWQAICSGFNIAEYIFPSPFMIANALVEFTNPIAVAAWQTFWVTMVGFGLSIVVGVLLGFLVGSARIAYSAVFPLLVAFNAVPKAAIVPILVVWFGIGIGPGILTAFLISFFPITVNIATGLATLEPELEDVLRVLSVGMCLLKLDYLARCPIFMGHSKLQSLWLLWAPCWQR